MNKYSTYFFKLGVAFIVTLALFASACKKDKKEDTPEPTKKELLSNKWGISDIQFSGISIINQDVSQIKCFKDNIFIINADGSYKIEEGATVCADSYASTGTWQLIENDTKLKFTPQSGSGDPLTITLIDVNETTLKTSYELNIVVPGTYTVILKKI